jgi:hypothetical protein
VTVSDSFSGYALRQCASLGPLRHIEHAFDNGSSFEDLVCLPHRLEGEVETGEMAELLPFQKPGSLLHGGVLSRFRHAIDQYKTDVDVAGLKLQRDRQRRRDAGDRDRRR